LKWDRKDVRGRKRREIRSSSGDEKRRMKKKKKSVDERRKRMRVMRIECIRCGAKQGC
jgi:hypothetical protein